ncbi:hypothetical protein BDZ89DRAFT_1056246 [Hymenopellis radicata]|nr:hypothetical protein BDZ89DRAFT_1056246 [Hymenopellis radicata]
MVLRHGRSALLHARLSLARRPLARFARFQSTERPPDSQPVERVPNELIWKGVASAGDTLKRTFIILAAVGAVVTVAGVALLEGYGQYFEHVRLAPIPRDPEIVKWGWEDEQLDWNGDTSKGGTDPGLGRKGRDFVRTAAASAKARNIMLNPESTRAKHNPSALLNFGLSNSVEALAKALAIAEVKDAAGKLHPGTLTLLLKHQAAMSLYERIWARETSPFVAWRLGDVCNGLGKKDEAVAWWSRAIQLCEGHSPSDTVQSAGTSTLPSSPAHQRVLASTLVSLSSYYATNGKLKEADALQNNALQLFQSSLPSESSDEASPPQALHFSTILQRASVVSLHHAEVLFGMGKKPAECIQWLSSAAEFSSHVARALAEKELEERPEQLHVSPAYVESPFLQQPAKDLFIEARRTAAEAWKLMGVLRERTKGDPKDLVHCYEQALKWSGKLDAEGNRIPDLNVTQSAKWDALVKNRNRLEEMVNLEMQRRNGWFSFLGW